MNGKLCVKWRWRAKQIADSTGFLPSRERRNRINQRCPNGVMPVQTGITLVCFK